MPMPPLETITNTLRLAPNKPTTNPACVPKQPLTQHQPHWHAPRLQHYTRHSCTRCTVLHTQIPRAVDIVYLLGVVVGAAVLAADVVGASVVVGAAVLAADAVGAAVVVGAAVLAANVVGAGVVVGATVVGAVVVWGASVVGATVLATAIVVP